MLKFTGIFTIKEVKELGKTKVMKLTHMNKSSDGKIKISYYDIWITEKVSKMVDTELKRNIKDAIVTVDGFLLIETKEHQGKKYQNNTIFPSSIERYKKGDKH